MAAPTGIKQKPADKSVAGAAKKGHAGVKAKGAPSSTPGSDPFPPLPGAPKGMATQREQDKKEPPQQHKGLDAGAPQKGLPGVPGSQPGQGEPAMIPQQPGQAVSLTPEQQVQGLPQQAMGGHPLHAFPHDPHTAGLFYAAPGNGFVPQYFYEYPGFDPNLARLPHEQWEEYLRMTGGNVAAMNGGPVIPAGLDNPEAAAAAAAAAAAQHQAAFGFHPATGVPGAAGPGMPQGATPGGAAAAFLPYGAPPAGSPPLPMNGQMYAPHAFQFQPPIFPPPVPPPPADPSKLGAPDQQQRGGAAGSATAQGSASGGLRPVGSNAGAAASGAPAQTGVQPASGPLPAGQRAPGGPGGAAPQGVVGGPPGSGAPAGAGAGTGRGFQSSSGAGRGRGGVDVRGAGRGWGPMGGKGRGAGGQGGSGQQQSQQHGGPGQPGQQLQPHQGHGQPGNAKGQQGPAPPAQMYPGTLHNGHYPPLPTLSNGFPAPHEVEQNRGPRTSRGRPGANAAGPTLKGNPGANGAGPMGQTPGGAAGGAGGNSAAGPGSLPDPRGINLPDFNTSYSAARFFVIKSYSEDNVHKSIKYAVWSSTPSGNKRLDVAFRDTAGLTGSESAGASKTSKGSGGAADSTGAPSDQGSACPVFLFFSVNASGQFCGVAEMTSPVDFTHSVEYWQQDKWHGHFSVKWHIIKDVPNSQFRHLLIAANENKPVTNSRDTQEVPLDQGLEMLRIFKNFNARTSILDDFGFYDRRQKDMQDRKARMHIGGPMHHPHHAHHPQQHPHHMGGGGGRHHHHRQGPHRPGQGWDKRQVAMIHQQPQAMPPFVGHAPIVSNGLPFGAPNMAPLLPKTSASLIDNRTPELSPVPTPPPSEAGAMAAAAAAAAAAAQAKSALNPALNPSAFPSLAESAGAVGPGPKGSSGGGPPAAASGLSVGGPVSGVGSTAPPLVGSLVEGLAEMRIAGEDQDQ